MAPFSRKKSRLKLPCILWSDDLGFFTKFFVLKARCVLWSDDRFNFFYKYNLLKAWCTYVVENTVMHCDAKISLRWEDTCRKMLSRVSVFAAGRRGDPWREQRPRLNLRSIDCTVMATRPSRVRQFWNRLERLLGVLTVLLYLWLNTAVTHKHAATLLK